MTAEEPTRLQIGHVLFIDVVGYSKLLGNEQSALLRELNEVVTGTNEFREAESANKLVRLPTGDGMALVFFTDPEAPAHCALEIARALKGRPRIALRMGIHSGPINEVVDVNQRRNIAGAGINMAQRVMDCGDTGHILVSKHVAEDLEQHDRWRRLLHDLGQIEVKHGARIGISNLYSDEIGNPHLPHKLMMAKAHRAKVRWAQVGIALIVVGALIATALYFKRPAALTASAVADNSVAVLPFVDMSQAKDQEFFSDGIAEELLNVLAKVPQLRVAARTSSFSFKGKQIGIPEIARQLHVAHVLEGSVRKSGDQVRITAQLIRAAEGYHLWSETYDRKLDDIFKIQDEIAGEVVKQLKVTLLGAAPSVRETDPEAYALYLRAQQLSRQFTSEAFTQSDALLKKVLEIDPRYAPAWFRLGLNAANAPILGLLPSSEAYARAREAYEKALAIDPNYAPAHGGLGYLFALNNDVGGAARHLERALELDPTDLTVVSNAASFLCTLGRLEEALPLNQAVARRDPVNPLRAFNLGVNQQRLGQFDAAIKSYRTALTLSPGYTSAHSWIGVALLLKGDAPAALAEIEQEKSEIDRVLGLPMALHGLGREQEADAALATLIAKFEKDAAYNIAYVYSFRGDADKAFEWLDRAVRYQDLGLGEIAAENLFSNIHSDPRWLPFLRKVGRDPAQLAKIDFEVTLPPQ